MNGRKHVRLATVFLYFATAALAQTVNFGITSGTAPNGTYGIMGGVYTSPYTGSVNGQSVAAICDDFSDDVTPPEYWTAIATNLANLGPSTTNNVYFLQGGGGSAPGGLAGTLQQYDYMVVATLAEQILTTTNETQRGYLSFALWEVFDPAAAGNLNTTQQGYAAADLLAAQNAVKTGITNSGLTAYLNTFSNVTLYSAVNQDGTVEAPGSGRPQEFVVVNMAEPSGPALLGLDLLGVAGLVLFVRRRFAALWADRNP